MGETRHKRFFRLSNVSRELFSREILRMTKIIPLMITTSSHQILWSSHCFWRISDSRLTVTMLLVVAVAMLLIIIFASCAQPLLIMGKSKHACCKEVMIACDERDYSSMSHVSKSGVDAHPDLRADKKTLGMLQSQQALNAIDE